MATRPTLSDMEVSARKMRNWRNSSYGRETDLADLRAGADLQRVSNVLLRGGLRSHLLERLTMSLSFHCAYAHNVSTSQRRAASTLGSWRARLHH